MFNLPKLIRVPKPRPFYVFETLKLDAGSHTWAEQMRLREERNMFFGREVIITTEGSGFPGLAKTYIR